MWFGHLRRQVSGSTIFLAHRLACIGPVIAELQAAGAWSLRDIAAALNERGIPTARETGSWSATQVMRVAGGPLMLRTNTDITILILALVVIAKGSRPTLRWDGGPAWAIS